ncbi:MAG: hypothetical protein HY262_10040 [Chloroflexi bacterium]|nr:hypothetical protein [Chloroflexota bacterium]
MARNLVEGRGLVSDALWSYQTPPLIVPPRAAFEVWLPLPSFLAALPMALFGTTFRAAQVSSVLVGALVPVLAWRLAADVARERSLPVGRARSVALGTGLVTAVYLPLVLGATVPDSTAPFTVLVLAASLLMVRIARDPRGARPLDPRLIWLGLLLGLTALTRNEAVWLALIWAAMAWFGTPAPAAVRARMIGVVAVVAAVVFAPWAYRDLVEFGTPLPGQAVSNALYLSGYDIFAWNDPPTLSRYLAQGPGWLVQLRIAGIGHNLFQVLLFLGIPLSLFGLVALPWQGRGSVLRPLLWVSLITFWVTSLVFPAATQWGTFLHGAGPVHVLLVISGLLALDAGIVRLGRRRGWTRPVAWLGPALGIFGSLLFSVALLPVYGSQSVATERLYGELGARMAAIGHPLDKSAGPVISNFPIWLAETQRIPTLGLPNEPPADVLDLARNFAGTSLLVLIDSQGAHWPADLTNGSPEAACFRELDLGPGPAGEPDPLAATRVFEIVCP